MAVGRISGPLLKSNLLRNGVDLAFETDLLYLDVNNSRIGIKTTTPTHEIQVNGTTRTNNLIVDTRADIADITITGNTISSANTLNLLTTGSDTVVYQRQLDIQSLSLFDNVISTNESNANIELRPNGTGRVEVYSDLQVNGDVDVSGDITIGGNITLGDADTDSLTFDADVASNIIPDQTDTYVLGSETKRWDNIYVNSFIVDEIVTQDLDVGGVDLGLRPGNIYYVSTNGDDANTGTHMNDPVASVKYALSIAGAGDVVHIYPGTYTEIFPLTVPVGVTVRGESLRSVLIQPTVATNDLDAFLLNGESTVEELTVGNFFYNSSNNTGHAFRFANNITVTSRSPYMRNITVITRGSTTTVEDPRGFNAGDAGRGAYIDGSVANSASKEASMLFHAATFITPGVDAIVATNGVRVEWLNSFTYFANRSFYALDGAAGKYNDGKTKIRLGGISGTFNATDQITFTSTDSSTVVGPLTIESVDNDIIIIDGKNEDLIGFDTTPASIVGTSGTATEILNYDLRDFGAEVRMIGSASVYGNFGLVGDGPGVIVYAIGHNLAYIGNGKEVTNDPGTVIQANEIIELNDAKIRYNSVDHDGDFRVGDLFFVDQQSGTVNFALNSLNIDLTNGVTFNTNGSTSFINGERIDIGNFRISGNTFESLSGDVNITAFSDQINLNNNVNIDGNLDVTGNVTIGGNITIGDDAGDTIQFVAGIDSDIIPSLDSTYSLGTQSLRWSNLYVNQVDVDDIQIRDNYITTTASNADLELRANGTGEIYVPSNNVQIDNGLTVNGDTFLANTQIQGTLTVVGDITQTGNFTLTGDMSVGQDLTVGASAQFEEILIDDNYITTTTSNTNLELRANGSGIVLIPNNDVQIVSDLTVDADINANNLTTTGRVTSDTFSTGDILIDNNTITTTLSNSDLELRANGTGEINVPTNDVTITQDLTVSGTTDLQDTNITGTITHVGDTVQTGNYTITGQFSNGDILIDSNIISTTLSNSDLELRANGSGTINVPTNNVIFSQDLTVSGVTDLQSTAVTGSITHTGNVVQTGNITLTGDYNVTGGVTISSVAQFEDVQIANNVITTTASNSDLELRAAGTGEVIVPNNDVVISNDLTVSGTITTGDINSAGTITANRFSTGDILIDDNFITTTTTNSDLELRANGTGEIYVPSNNVIFDQDLTVNGSTDLDDLNIEGNVTHTGNTTQTGNINITGNLTVSGEVTVSSAMQFENIRIAGNVLETTLSNSDLELRANGTGLILVPNDNVQIVNDLTVGKTLFVNDITATGTITANNFTTGDILIDDNYITTTTSNSDLELRANGTGNIIIDDFTISSSTITTTNDLVLDPGSEHVIINSTGAIKIPTGNSLQRPGTPSTGQIRYNTDLLRFEGYNGTNWIILQGVEDLDGNTKITAELNEGDNDGVIRFYSQGSLIADLDATRLNVEKLTVDDITIDNNEISTTTANTDLRFNAQGTGSVVFENFAIKNNTITNTSSNSVTLFQNTNSGYVKFEGTYGLVIPSGTSQERPAVAYREIGMQRFNVDDQRVEIFDGIQWVSVAGAQSGITPAEANDLAVETVLMLG